MTARGSLRYAGLSTPEVQFRLVENGALLRRRGYLFEVTRLTPLTRAATTPSALLCGESGCLRGELAVRAWPWAHGTTGRASFLATRGGAQLVHANDLDPWQGLGSARADLGPLTGWRALP